MLQQQTTSKLDEYKGERKLDVRIYAYFKKMFYLYIKGKQSLLYISGSKELKVSQYLWVCLSVRSAWSVNTNSSYF